MDLLFAFVITTVFKNVVVPIMGLQLKIGYGSALIYHYEVQDCVNWISQSDLNLVKIEKISGKYPTVNPDIFVRLFSTSEGWEYTFRHRDKTSLFYDVLCDSAVQKQFLTAAAFLTFSAVFVPPLLEWYFDYLLPPIHDLDLDLHDDYETPILPR